MACLSRTDAVPSPACVQTPEQGSKTELGSDPCSPASSPNRLEQANHFISEPQHLHLYSGGSTSHPTIPSVTKPGTVLGAGSLAVTRANNSHSPWQAETYTRTPESKSTLQTIRQGLLLFTVVRQVSHQSSGTAAETRSRRGLGNAQGRRHDPTWGSVQNPPNDCAALLLCQYMLPALNLRSKGGGWPPFAEHLL